VYLQNFLSGQKSSIRKARDSTWTVDIPEELADFGVVEPISMPFQT
jgi:hypothetical protein